MTQKLKPPPVQESSAQWYIIGTSNRTEIKQVKISRGSRDFFAFRPRLDLTSNLLFDFGFLILRCKQKIKSPKQKFSTVQFHLTVQNGERTQATSHILQEVQNP
uniref:Uncharacterized protein n=1 Tax=Cacopsylla melanoneura TaxID=428564 RepID=A0A8D9A8N6_9HEMI